VVACLKETGCSEVGTGGWQSIPPRLCVYIGSSTKGALVSARVSPTLCMGRAGFHSPALKRSAFAAGAAHPVQQDSPYRCLLLHPVPALPRLPGKRGGHGGGHPIKMAASIPPGGGGVLHFEGIMPSEHGAAGVSRALEARGGWERGQHGSAETRTCQGISPSASWGGNGRPRVGTGLPEGGSWKPSVPSCHAWEQPRGPGATVLGAHLGSGVLRVWVAIPAPRQASPPLVRQGNFG